MSESIQNNVVNQTVNFQAPVMPDPPIMEENSWLTRIFGLNSKPAKELKIGTPPPSRKQSDTTSQWLPSLTYKHIIDDSSRAFMEKTRESLEKLSTIKHDLTENAKTTLDSGFGEITKLRELVEWVCRGEDRFFGASVVDSVVIFLVTLFNTMQAQTWKMRVSIVSQTLLASGILKISSVSAALVEGVATLIGHFCDIAGMGQIVQEKPEIEMVAHLKTDPDSFLSGLWEAIVEFFSNLFAKDETLVAQGNTEKLRPPPSTLRDLSRTIGNVKTIGQGIEYVSKMLWQGISWAYLKTTGTPLITDSGKELVHRAVEWIQVFHKYLEESQRQPIINSSEFCQRIIQHEKDGMSLSKDLLESGYTKANFTPFFKALEEIKGLAANARTCLATAKPRMAPLCVQFSGPPEVGKSHTRTAFARDAWMYWNWKRGVKIPATQNVIFERKLDNEYWEGYQNHFATSIDDYFQHDDKPQRTQTALEIIYMNNVSPYPLHMAGIEKKSSTFFDSKLLILTSNAVETPELALQDIKAFKRRRDFLVKVTIREEYITTVEGRRQISFKGADGSTYSRNVWNLSLFDPVSERPLPGFQNLTYDQFFKIAMEKFDKKFSTSADFAEWLDQHPIDFQSMFTSTPTPILVAHGKEDKQEVNYPNRSHMDDVYYETNNQLTFEKDKVQMMEVTRSFVAHDPTDKKVEQQFSEGDRLLMRITDYVGKLAYIDGKGLFVCPAENFRPIPSTILAHGVEDVDESEFEKLRSELRERRERDEINAALIESLKAHVAAIESRIKTLDQESAEKITAMKVANETHKRGSTVLSFGIGVVSCLAAVGSLYGVFKYFFGEKEDQTAEAQGGKATATGASKGTEPKTSELVSKHGVYPVGKKRMVRPMTRGVAQSGNEFAALSELLKNTVSHQMGKIKIREKVDTPGLSCNVVFVKGRTAITAKHMFRHLKDLEGVVELHMNRNNEKYSVKTEEIQFWEDPDNDLVLMRFPKHVQPFKDIVHHFVNEADLVDGDISSTIMFYKDPEHPTPVEMISNDTRRSGKADYRYKAGSDVIITSWHTLEYSCRPVNGDCASIIATTNTKFPRKILGAHVAGCNNIGKCVVVSYEYLTSFFEEYPEEGVETVAQGLVEIVKGVENPVYVDDAAAPSLDYSKGENITYLGKVEPKLGHRLPNKSEIVPSLFHREFTEPITAPAMLRPTDGIAPLQNAIDKVNVMTKKPLDRTLLRHISEALLAQMEYKVPPRMLTDYEAINGVASWKHMQRIHLNTSKGFTGYPSTGRKGKYEFFLETEGSEILIPTIEFRRRLDLMENSYRHGATGIMICEANLKDERRPLAKVAEGRTRLFTACETSHLVLGRKACGAYLENLQLCASKLGIGTGVNPHSIQWGFIADKPRRNGETKLLDGDASNYDWNTNKDLEDEYIWIQEEWYRRGAARYAVTYQDSDALLRRGLERDGGSNALLLIMRDLVRVGAGLCSGTYDTIHRNSIGGQLAHRYCIKKRADKIREALTMNDFETVSKLLIGNSPDSLGRLRLCTTDFLIQIRHLFDDLDLQTCGDDFVLWLAQRLQWYNFHMLQEEMKEVGWTYTAADKSNEVYTHRKEGEVTYLKRYFKRENGLVFAPMDVENILEILNWQSSRMDPKEAAKNLVDVVLREFFHHGEDKFNVWKAKLNLSLREKGVSPVNLYYHELLCSFLAPETSVVPLDEPILRELSIELMPINVPTKKGVLPAPYALHSQMLASGVYTPLQNSNPVTLVAQGRHEIIRHVDKMESLLHAGQKRTKDMACLYAIENVEKDLKKLHDLVYCKTYVPRTDQELTYFRQMERLLIDTKQRAEKALVDARKRMKLSFVAQGGYTSVLDAFYHSYHFKPEMVFELKEGVWFGSMILWGNKFKTLGANKQTCQERMMWCAVNYYGIWAGEEVEYDESLIKKSLKLGDRVDGTIFCESDPPPRDQWAKEYRAKCEKDFFEEEEETKVVREHLRNIDFKIEKRPEDASILEIRQKLDQLRKRLDIIEDKLEFNFVAQMSSEAPGGEVESVEDANVEIQELTQTRDIHTIAITAKPRRVQPYYVGTDPYPDQGMTPVLERKYRIMDITWSGASTFDAELERLNFPYELINAAPTLADKLRRFHFMRADMRIEFRVNGTQFHYGKLMIGWLPHTLSSSSLKLGNIYTLSTCNATTLSANTNVVQTVIIPYVSPKVYMTDEDWTEDIAHLGVVCIRVLNKLSLMGSASTPTVKVSVFANFENIEIAGPSINGLSPGNGPCMYTGSYLAHLSDEYRRKGDTSNLVRLRNFLFRSMSAKQKHLFIAQMKKEQKAKSQSGVISSTLNAIGGFAGKVATLGMASPEIAVGAKVVNIAATGLGALASAFGYNKPTSTAAFQPIYNSTVNSMASGSGLNVVQDLSMIPENAASNIPANFGRSDDEHSFASIITKPGLIETWSFTSASPAGKVVKTYHVTPTMAATYHVVATGEKFVYNNPCSLIAYMFRFWRGTLKYRVEIVCSKFTNGRLRISWHPLAGEIPDDFSQGEGDFISSVVEFCGDTNYNFSVPYLADTLYKKCDDAFIKSVQGTNGALAFSIVNPVVSSDTVGDSTVYVNVYMAADADMQFLQPIDKQNISGFERLILNTGTLQGVWMGQGGEETCVLDDIFKADFPPLVPATRLVMSNVCAGEEVKDVLTLLHRYQIYDAAGSVSNNSTTLVHFDEGSLKDRTINILNRYYLFRRGSFLWKAVRRDDANDLKGSLLVEMTLQNLGGSTIPPTDFTELFGRNGTVMEDVSYKPSLEWRVPYYASVPIVPGVPHSASESDEICSYLVWKARVTDAALKFYLFIAVGDDFSFGWACGCPAYHLAPIAIDDEAKNYTGGNLPEKKTAFS